jgi:hypothetical protein
MICNECETVAHCTKHGCVPKKDNSNYRYDQPVAEPVAVVSEDKHGPFVDWLGDKSSFYERNPVGTKFYTTPPAQPAPVQEPVGYEYHEYRPYGAPGEIRINAILKSRYTMPDGSTAGDYQWLIDQYRASKNTIKLIPRYTTPPAQPAVPLTDEEIDAKFDAFASKFDHESNEWLDMGANAYFRAGFRAAHGITVTPEKGGTP